MKKEIKDFQLLCESEEQKAEVEKTLTENGVRKIPINFGLLIRYYFDRNAYTAIPDIYIKQSKTDIITYKKFKQIYNEKRN